MPVTIKFNYYIPDDYSDQFMMRSFYFYHSGNIEFYAVNLDLPEIPLAHQSGKLYPHGASVVRSNSSSLVTTQLGVRLSKVNIIVPEPEKSEWHFIGNPSGMTDLVFANVTLPAAWRDRNKMFFQGRLSDTIFGKRTVNTTTALSTSNTIYNDGRVK